MPFLEQSGRPHPDKAQFLASLSLTIQKITLLSRRHWPVFWFALQMLAFATGGHFSASLTMHLELPPEILGYRGLVRITALLPALLLGKNRFGMGFLWCLVLGGNVLAGALESAERNGRQSVVVAAPWAVAERIEHRGDAVLRITGWVRVGEGNRWGAPARLLAWLPDSPLAEADIEIGDGVYLRGKGDQPQFGQVIAGPLALSAPRQTSLAGSFDYRRFLTGRSLKWLGKSDVHRLVESGGLVSTQVGGFLHPLRQHLLQRLDQMLPRREAQLAAAVLLGIRSQGSKEISAPFTALGLAHLFAVSGLHVGILLGIVLLPGKLWNASPRMAVTPLWIFVPLYLLLTGLPGSVVRAGGMGLLAAQAKPFGRRADPLRLLGLLYWWGTLWEPAQNLDTGLQLSYLAAGGILLLSRVTGGFQLSQHRLLKPITTGLAVGFAAQWFTMPVIAGSFGYLSLISPLANLIAVPLFALAIWCVVLALSLSVVCSALGQWLGAVAWLLLRSIEAGVTWLTRGTGGYPLGLKVPTPLHILGWIFLSFLLLILLQNRPDRRSTSIICWAVLPLLLLSIFSPDPQEIGATETIEVWQFDVGQGDCGLIRFPDGWTAMIDTGGRFGHHAKPSESALARTILPFLRRQGIKQLDGVLLSHGHFDHTGGAAALASWLPVESWFVAGKAGRALVSFADSSRVMPVVAGDVLHRWRDWELVVVYPLVGQTQADGENNWSMVVTLKRKGEHQMVWSGDLELEGEVMLLKSQPELRRTRVWKAGHHGSNTSGSEGMLALLQPDLILISCGVGNSYHHPSHGPYISPNSAANDTISLLRTDLSGSIRLRWEPGGAIAWQTMTAKGILAPVP